MVAEADAMADTNQELLGLAAYLLSYPNEQWLAAFPEAKEQIASLEMEATRTVLTDVVAYIEGELPKAYEDEYVRVFDFSQNTNLYLASYDCSAAGEQAEKLLKFKELYERNGFDVASELPDYVPALLELCATVDAKEAHRIGHTIKPYLELLRQRLIDSKQVHAFVLDVVLNEIERWEREAQ